MLKYAVAFLFAGIIILGGYLFCQQTMASMNQHIKQALESSSLPADEKTENLRNLEAGLLPELGLEIPPDLLWKFQLTELLTMYWYIGILFVLTVCLGIAYLIPGRSDKQTNQESRP